MFLGKKKSYPGRILQKQASTWQESQEDLTGTSSMPYQGKRQADLRKVAPAAHNFVAFVDSFLNVLAKAKLQILHLQLQHSATAGQMKWKLK